MKKRVVITGMGIVSSLGIGKDKFWNSIKEGKNGISHVEKIDITQLNTKVAAEVKDFNPQDFIEKKEIKRMDRFTQFAVSAAKIAVEESNLNIENVDKYRMGVIIGSGIGGIQTFEEQYQVLSNKGSDRVSPFFVPMMISNIASGVIAIQYGAKGFNECVVTACASSTNALGDAFKVIQRGDADVMISGGSEAAITPLAFAGFCSLRAMSQNEDPSTASRPFDLDRDGFIMGEGSAVLVLEEMEHALNRGADIIAEIIGYGCTNDAYHITAPSPEGEAAAKCMSIAIKDAGINATEIGYINAHGTSTEYNDKFETKAVKIAFGEHALKVPMSSTKSMTGHLLGAAGALEAAISALALRDSFLPPTTNYKTFDPECDLDYIANQGRNVDINYAMSNSFGFGGHNATLILKKH